MTPQLFRCFRHRCRGDKYVVTLVDYFSKRPEAALLNDKTTLGVALFLYDTFCRYIIFFAFMSALIINLIAIIGLDAVK